MLQPQDSLHGFTVKSTESLPEIDGDAIVMRHDVSGAQLLYLRNDDDNKAFSIAFKTPPADDTGVFHILEHSVLCGSDKFPVKEPFVNLLKTSMQTFLNAMTFPDKTMYPVASTNEQDLLNLMDVYLDAVLNPAIYGDRRIFEQEGWHYEIDDAQADQPERLRYNGVVFNEMKGALSDPESVLYHAVNRALFPDTCYAFESGGRPRAIPGLTYEGYLDTHARHYRLDNSYIVLYGNLDIDRVLGFLDESYLSKPQRVVSAGPNELGVQAPRIAQGEVVHMETAPENACVGLSYVISDAHDFERVLATDILLDALMGGNESPLKRAVLDAGLGGDCVAYLTDSQAQPAALFMLKNAQPGAAEKFQRLIEEESAKLADQGIPRDVLEASLSQMAFDLRERDRGIADGVVLAMNALSGWLYNDEDATLCLHYEGPLASMRAGLDGTYFEDLLREVVVESNHMALVDLQPSTEDLESEEALELADKLASLDEQGKQHIRDEVAGLRARQEAPDDPADLARLPQLHVSDIGPAVPDPEVAVVADRVATCLHHDIPARRINYLYCSFDLGHITWDEVPYATLMAMLLGGLDTQDHTAAELDVLARTHLGSLHFMTDVHVRCDDHDDVRLMFTAAASALSEEVEHLARIPREVWAHTKFDDADRIKDRLVQKRIALEDAFTNAGHTNASARVGSYLFKSGVLGQQLNGIDFYLFLKDLIDNFDDRFDDLKNKLAELQRRVFVRDGAVVSFTGSQDELDAFWNAAGDLGLCDRTLDCDVELVIPDPKPCNEAFIVPSDVCYVSKGADLSQLSDYSGSWVVLGSVESFDYLWNEVRVKGGAYGVGFRRTPQGLARFHSFRDPSIDDTLARYDAAGSWLAAFDPTQEEMEGYVVSTVASHDAPAKPRAIARRQDAAYFAGRPADFREKMREQKLSVTADELRGLADQLDTIARQGNVCVFGSADIISQADFSFDTVTTLFGE